MGRPTETIELAPTALVAGGDAIARDAEGRVVFIRGALPGERVRVEITGSRRDYRHARTVEVVEPSPWRQAAPCPHVADGCGGCQWQHIAPAGQHEFKRGIVVDALRRLGRQPEPAVAATVELAPWAWRTTIRASVIDGRAGFKALNSNMVTPVDACLVAHPLLDELITTGRYPAAHEVLLRCGARTGERIAVPTPAAAAIEVPAGTGRSAYHEAAAGRRWRISAASFFQARPDGADALAALVLNAAAELGEPRSALDLYGGVGLFAGALAEAGWTGTTVEGSATSSADAAVNLAGLDCTVVHGDVTRTALPPAEFVVADPSRAGLGRDTVDAIASTGAARVVLVSCDAAALGRDTNLLTAAGFRLHSVTPVDLFPHTFHVETVSVFDRA